MPISKLCKTTTYPGNIGDVATHMREVNKFELSNTVVEYFPLSIVTSKSKYDSLLGHSVVLLS